MRCLPFSHWSVRAAIGRSCAAVSYLAVLMYSAPGLAQASPVLNSIFPAGGRAGSSVEVTVAGSGIIGLKTLHCSTANLSFEVIDKTHVRVSIPQETPPGFYDLRAVCENGLSSPRAFMIGTRQELVESEPNEGGKAATVLPLNSVVNGRIEKKGDIDHFRFVARKGQLVVVECRAERIDSRLRAVLELYDEGGQRLAVNRGYFGIDPLIAFRVPVDGAYTVKVFDLIYAGGADYAYRLSVGNRPRVVFSHPAVVRSGETTRVKVFGWNLKSTEPGVRVIAGNPDTSAVGAEADPESPRKTLATFDAVEVDVKAPAADVSKPIRLSSTQAGVEGFAYHFQDDEEPFRIGISDSPVVLERSRNHSSRSAQSISIPCEVSGRLVGGDEHDWYTVDVRRGEVLWVEGIAARMGAPVDLDVSILDASGERELARFSDELRNIGGKSFKTAHTDPAGRWVAPDDGRYLILVRNVIGSLFPDERRVYRLSVRREEPDFALIVIDPRDGPASLNVQRGGRTTVDVLAIRRRGMTGTIRVSARNLPTGIECPDVYLGPGIDRATLTLSASDSAEPLVGRLDLVGHAVDQRYRANNTASDRNVHQQKGRAVRGGAVIRAGDLNGAARYTADIPFAVAGDASVRITADGNEPRSHQLYGKLNVRHSPGSVVDVAVQVDRRDASHQAAVELIGVGLPSALRNQTATIPAGQSKGYISFYLPPTLPVGIYTFAVKGVTTAPATSLQGKPRSLTLFSNPLTIDVRPAAFVVEMDPYAPKQIRRGEVVQVKYSARRLNGFISKIHTELFAPDKVIGLRGRGVTFVGQTDAGTIQIIANEDAPLGQQPFVRFYAVGVVEDRPVYHGSCFLNLEITE